MTLAYNTRGDLRGSKEVNSTYIVATALDTTATVNGPSIDNRDGRVSRVAFGHVVTASTGTSPTLTTTLQGSLDGSTWFTVLDSAGNAVATSADDISSPTVSEFEDTNQEGIDQFPPFLRVSSAVGGSNSPGWTGSVLVDIDRNPEKRG